MSRLNFARIESAVSVISPMFLNTPQYECEALGEILGCRVFLKVETQNPIRCFKGRGTELAVSHCFDRQERSVVCASAGNLGQAVAFSCRGRGIAATVVASAHANARKLDAIARLGARLVLVDGDIEMARTEAQRLASADGLFLIEDSENIDTCEGAGTIGLELADGPPIDAVLIALGGGAMATGVGHVLNRLSPKTEIVCVQPAGAPALTLSLRAGKVIETETIDTIADGVAGRCPIEQVLADLMDIAPTTLLVKETSIILGMRLLFEHAGLIVEPSAALGIAALLENRETYKNQRVATIVCGGNVEPMQYIRWVDGESHSVE